MKQLHLGVFLQGVGHTILWRHPNHADFTKFETYVEFAQLAERGKFDFIFFGEGLVVREHFGRFFGPIVNGRPDTVALLPALAAVTKHVGLAATISSTYNHPYELSRQLAGIDHVSGGRAAWNVVTTFSNSAARGAGGDVVAYNFSKQHHLQHATRYNRAREFLNLAKQLWDSWADQTLSKQGFDGTTIRAVNHRDTWFEVKGPLDTPRPPQGHPVIIQAGQSDDGRDLAARHADVIFSPHRNIEDAKAMYQDIKTRLESYGRSKEQLKILPGLSVVVGITEAEAQAKSAEYKRLLSTPEIAKYLLGEQSGFDFTPFDAHAPFPEIPNNPDLDLELLNKWKSLADSENLSLKQLAERVQARWNSSLVGTPSQIADHIERWLTEEASDGFILTPVLFPDDLRDFVDLVVPELQRRGLFRLDYTGQTLRHHLGLPIPERQPAANPKNTTLEQA